LKHAAIAVASLLAAVTACSSNGLTVLSPRPNVRLAPQALSTQAPLLYVADSYAHEVAVYRQKGNGQQPVGELTTQITFPMSVWVDTHRNVWVANVVGEAQSNILRFPEGKTKPDLTLPDRQWNVSAIWVARNDAVYAVNGGSSGNVQIVEYPPHSNKSKQIGDPNLPDDITSIVGDARGDLFASGLALSGAGEVDELLAGSTQWRNTGIALVEPGGLAFDRSGNLVVSDMLKQVIGIYPLERTSPKRIIHCGEQCSAIAFDHTGTRLWVDELNDLNGTIDEFEYKTGKFIQTLPQPSESYPLGIATSPDLYP
jgi:DNA-binding beta-propeller fold protein YncE